jgi:hypothetical protein
MNPKESERSAMKNSPATGRGTLFPIPDLSSGFPSNWAETKITRSQL